MFIFHLKHRRWLPLFLIIALFFSVLPMSVSATEQQIDLGEEAVTTAVYDHVEPKLSDQGDDWESVLTRALNHLQMKGQSVHEEWEVIGLARAGEEVDTSYLESFIEYSNKQTSPLRKVTDYERFVLALTAIGEDPYKYTILETNLIESIYNHSNVTMQGINGPAFALIALDSKPYPIPDDAKWTREDFLTYILEQQNDDGGFALVKAFNSDVDITAMVLQALSNYLEREDVSLAVEEALQWLLDQQNDDGGFKNAFNEANIESTAQVVIALTSLGIDPATDPRLIKEEGNPISNILSYAQADGGFAHTIGGSTNNMATEQAVLALVAYDRFQKGKNKLYDMSAEGSAPVQPPTDDNTQPIDPPAEPPSDDHGDGELPGDDNSGNTGGGGGSEGGGQPQVPPVTKKTITIAVHGPVGEGYFLSPTEIELLEGDTAYTVLERAMPGRVQARGSGKTLYVEAINGLGEFDRGPLSGWLYEVNGIFPNYSAGIYQLREKDQVHWRYTTDLGRDVGGYVPGVDNNLPGAGGEVLPPKYSPIQNEANRLPFSVNNRKPAQELASTIQVINQDKRMSLQEATKLKEKLARNSFTLQESISPAVGGSLADNEGEIELFVPVAATERPTQFQVEKLKNIQSYNHDGAVLSGIYRFSPAGARFDKPVFISIKTPLLIDDLEDLALAWWEEQKKQWIPIPAVVDAEQGIVTGMTDHFTKFAVIDTSKLEGVEKKLRDNVWQRALEQALGYIQQKHELSEWEAVGLAQAGKIVPPTYLSKVKKLLEETQGQFRKVTDYERITLALTALGHDPQHVAGFNLLENIYNNERMLIQGINGPTFALIALDSKAYPIPEDALWTREKLIQTILKQQNDDGGFALAEEYGKSDVDITAMVLQGLAVYKKRADVELAINKALLWLSEQQLANGGYGNFADEENSESIAQVIIALTSLDIDPLDARFVKKEGNLLTALLRFAQKDGGFAHTWGQESNDIATEQAILALVAYQRWLDKELPLFDMRKVEEQASEQKAEDKPLHYLDAADISFWAVEAVNKAQEYGLMHGVNQEFPRFEPQRAITRAEFAKLLLNLAGEDVHRDAQDEAELTSTVLAFRDVGELDWYSHPVAKAVQNGWVKGISPELFQPNRSITREEMAVMISRMLQLEDNTAATINSPLTDLNEASDWAIPAITQIYEQEIMVGDQGAFKPQAEVTREMAAVIIVRLYQLSQ